MSTWRVKQRTFRMVFDGAAAMSQARAELGTQESTACTESSSFPRPCRLVACIFQGEMAWPTASSLQLDCRRFAKCHAGKLVRPDAHTRFKAHRPRSGSSILSSGLLFLLVFHGVFILGFFFKLADKGRRIGQIVSIIDALYKTCCHDC